MAFSLIFDALHVVVNGWDVYQRRKKAHASKIDMLLNEARAASGPEAIAIFAKVCGECARRVEKKPRDAHAMRQWAVALWWRAARASGAEADQIYEQADYKFSQAQAIAPHDGQCCADRVEALRYRAALHHGGKGRRLLRQVCELCRQRVGIVSSGPHDARMLHSWGMALWWLAAGETGAEARRLYQEADQRFAKAILLEPKEADYAVDRADALRYAAALETGDEQREMFQSVCRQCRQLAERGAGGPRMLAIWAGALYWLARITTGADSERFSIEAEKKAARALAIDPGTAHAAETKLRALVHRALLQGGEARSKLLAQACDEFGRLAKARPLNADLLRGWGTALSWRGAAANRTEAERLFAEAAEKYSLGLKLSPANEHLSTGLASALAYRAKLLSEEAARPLILRAGELLEGALNSHPANGEALTCWAEFLAYRARIMPGEETARMASEAVRRFEAAARDGVNPDAILRGWGTALWTLANCVDGGQSARLIEEAKAKLLESETRVPRSAAYYLAYLYARTGDGEECRRWLEASGEPGLGVSRDWLEAEPEFARVRECDWFRQLLARQG